MITYKLNKYGSNCLSEEIVFENENQDVAVEKAIKLSYEGEKICGFWNYRLDKWENGKWAGGQRFFNNGVEFTQGVIQAAVGELYA